MFAQSTQKKYWMFPSESAINEKRVEQNQKYIEKHGAGIANKEEFFLTPMEERLLLQQYELHLSDFCRRFNPPMPKIVVGTAFHYFKRFYINNSPMDYHPKEILATCVYLACKVEEFNISIGHFLTNVKGDRAKAMDIILSNELLMMQQLNYYLTVHNAFRALNGLVLDVKTRMNLYDEDFYNRLKIGGTEFIERTFLTDAPMIYAPSQIALAAIFNVAIKESVNLDQYVTEKLFKGSRDKLPVLVEAVRNIRSMDVKYEAPPKDVVRAIEKKLEQCRNQENNPDSQVYKEKMRKMLLEDENDMPLSSAFKFNESSEDTSMLNISL